MRNGRPGSKHPGITDAGGTPLRVSLTGGNRNDITQLLPLVEALSPVRGRPRRKPRQLCLDRAYGHDIYRSELPDRGLTPRIVRRGHEHGSGLDAARWVAEAVVAWLHGPRRLRIRWGTRDDIHEGFLQLARCMILAAKLPVSAS